MATKKTTKPKQADRYNTGKPKLSYILDFPNAMTAMSRVCEQGAEKYARHNWKKGMPVTEIEDSLMRHAMAFNACNDTDPESKQLHAAHMMWNCAALIEVLARHGNPLIKGDNIFDDRNNDHPTNKG